MADGYKTILVPVDGSEAVEEAFDKAVKIATENGGKIDVLNVVDTRQFIGEVQDILTNGDTIYQVTQDSKSYLTSLKKWAKDNFDFGKIDYHTRYGSPKRIISYDFIKDNHNDLTVMGATGLNAAEGMLVGPVTEYVNQHAMAGILIIRADLENKEINKKKQLNPNDTKKASS